jgi:RNA polymerase sporulation-specific sigma factor
MLSLLINILSSNFLIFALHFEGGGKFPKPLTAKQERECFELMAKGDKSAREKLISHNLRLVAHIVKKYGVPSGETDDLISIGTIGLIKAVGTFDYTKGCRFATYGARCVENEILMHFRSTKKLASEMHFDEPVDVDKNGNCLTLIDIIADDDMPVSEKSELSSNLQKLHKCMDTVLEKRERDIIIMRYGLGKSPPVTQREAACKLGISRSYISRLEKKALEKLRDAMNCP